MIRDHVLSENVTVRVGATDGHVDVAVRISLDPFGLVKTTTTLRIEAVEVPLAAAALEEAMNHLRSMGFEFRKVVDVPPGDGRESK